MEGHAWWTAPWTLSNVAVSHPRRLVCRSTSRRRQAFESTTQDWRCGQMLLRHCRIGPHQTLQPTTKAGCTAPTYYIRKTLVLSESNQLRSARQGESVVYLRVCCKVVVVQKRMKVFKIFGLSQKWRQHLCHILEYHFEPCSRSSDLLTKYICQFIVLTTPKAV